VPHVPDDEEQLTAEIVDLARQYGRYGYRRITALLRASGWAVNKKRVERIWRREGLKVPQKQPKRGRLWLADGSCIRLRPEHRNHVWSYDFVEDRTHDGRKFRMLNIIDEYSRQCLAIRVRRRFTAGHVVEVLSELMILHGTPGHIRSDQGPEFLAKAVQDWIAQIGAKTAYIEKASPWENGYCESFNSKLRDELLDREIFYSLREAEILIESWRVHYNTQRPHLPGLQAACTRGPALADLTCFGERSAGHPTGGAEPTAQLTFALAPPQGAGHWAKAEISSSMLRRKPNVSSKET
jgi:transposase InsO family protein